MEKFTVELDYSSGCPEIQAEDKIAAEKLGCQLTFGADHCRHALGFLTGTRIQITHFLNMVYFVDSNGKFTGTDKDQKEYYQQAINSIGRST